MLSTTLRDSTPERFAAAQSINRSWRKLPREMLITKLATKQLRRSFEPNDSNHRIIMETMCKASHSAESARDTRVINFSNDRVWKSLQHKKRPVNGNFHHRFLQMTQTELVSRRRIGMKYFQATTIVCFRHALQATIDTREAESRRNLVCQCLTTRYTNLCRFVQENAARCEET